MRAAAPRARGPRRAASARLAKAVVAKSPGPDCALCPRLAAFRADNRRAFPDFVNAPIPPFGDAAARLLVVGLAPGLKGANRTGRPFTGDAAGELLYAGLRRHGFARGTFRARADDGLVLEGACISNAVKCVPPGNKPLPAEIATCNPFLAADIARLAKLQAFLALGRIAHDAVLRALDLPRARTLFAHGARHVLAGNRVLYDSYHCSRYNTNTGRLTPAMFDAVLARIAAELARPA